MTLPTDYSNDLTEQERSEKMYWLSNPLDLNQALVHVQHLAFINNLTPVDRSMITTILSELGSNILKYATRGALKIRCIDTALYTDIEIAAEDKGPGIANPELALQDFYSTGGTLGLGLSGVKRMSDFFSVQTSQTGTAIVCRKRIRGPSIKESSDCVYPPVAFNEDDNDYAAAPIAFDWGSYVRPCPGFAATGDSLLLIPRQQHLLLAVIDAAGHGDKASIIRQRVETVITETSTLNMSLLLQKIHEQLCGSQGAAVGLMIVNTENGSYRYAGVGNTRMQKIGRKPLRGLSKDGVLGSRLPRLLIQDDQLSPGDLVMLWTDGLPELESTHFVQTNAFRSAASISKQWALRLGKLHDDAGCGVMKWGI